MALPMSGSPKPRPMTHAEPRPIPESHPMGAVPPGHTYALRVRFAGGWDTYGTYESRELAMEEYARLRADGVVADSIIVCRV